MKNAINSLKLWNGKQLLWIVEITQLITIPQCDLTFRVFERVFSLKSLDFWGCNNILTHLNHSSPFTEFKRTQYLQLFISRKNYKNDQNLPTLHDCHCICNRHDRSFHSCSFRNHVSYKCTLSIQMISNMFALITFKFYFSCMKYICIYPG